MLMISSPPQERCINSYQSQGCLFRRELKILAVYVRLRAEEIKLEYSSRSSKIFSQNTRLHSLLALLFNEAGVLTRESGTSLGHCVSRRDCKVTLMNGQRFMLDFTSMEGYDSTNFFDAERHVEKGNKIDPKEVNNVFGIFDGRSGENSLPSRTKLYSVNVATDVDSSMSPPVPDVRDLNFESDVRTSDVTGSCSEENDKSLSMYEGLDKVGLNSFGPANMDLKIIMSDTTTKYYCHGFTTGTLFSPSNTNCLKQSGGFKKDLKQNPSRLNFKWCRRAAFYEFIDEDSEYSNEDDDCEENYDFDQNSRS
ncbi:hypothetical protein Tco_0897306 [Tanacetum coccineum]